MAQGGEAARRIEGWKSIAAYLGRDRSTAIRWSRERGLPVHALPGGRARSVYALAHELDAWISGQEALPPDPALTDPTPAAPPPANPPSATPPASDPLALPRPAPPRRWPIVLGALALLGISVAAIEWIGPSADRLDAATHARFVAARDDVAMRSAPRLHAAIATLTRLAQTHPGNVEVQEALAEAWLLTREFGSASDTLSISRARAAAAAARAIDPHSAVADRVDGVIAYWWDGKPQLAGELFRRAIGHAPGDPLAHLWYANILADNGEDAAAQREFDTARTLAPGAPWLLADYGWGLWSAGRTAQAQALLTTLAGQYPTLASVHDALSVTALAEGDLAGYARHLAARARARGEPELITYSTALQRTIDSDRRAGNGPAATYAVILSRAVAITQNDDQPDHSWPAFVAAVAGDRATLLTILNDARARGEQWGSAGFIRRIRARYAGDRAIDATLSALAQPRIDPA
jgi:Tfp pilus assembly protein PilF